MTFYELYFCLENTLYGFVLPFVLLLGGAYLLFRLGAFPFRHPKRTARLFVKKEKDGASPVKAMTMALAGTLGVGNISGVALAIASGGAGALFWMWVAALFSMILKYAEVTLAMRFRADGGSAMAYMAGGLKGRNGRRIAAVFAVLCLFAAFTVGGLVQANAIAEALSDSVSASPLLVGVLLSLVTAAVIFGGAKKISDATVLLVPPVTLLYILMSLILILKNANGLPQVFLDIIGGAFDFRSAGGGVFGFLFSRAVRFGTTRGLLSNEAGCGTAPMAHATSGSDTPAKQGLFGIFEVFVDTIVLCSLTGIGILLAAPEMSSGGGIRIVTAAFSTVFGGLSPFLVSVSVVVFALATVFCWAYYGETALTWLTKRKKAQLVYRILFCLSLTLGAILAVEAVFSSVDLVLCFMTVLNVAVLLRLSPLVREETEKAGLL